MPEVRLTVDEGFIEGLKKDTGVDKTSKLTDEAFALYQWAVGEVKNGRVLISTDKDGNNPQRIVTPTFEKMRSL